MQRLCPILTHQDCFALLLGAIAQSNAFFGQGTGPILLDDLRCTCTETRLIDCPSDGVGNSDFCNGHADDAGVQCNEGMLIARYSATPRLKRSLSIHLLFVTFLGLYQTSFTCSIKAERAWLTYCIAGFTVYPQQQ